MRRGFAVLLAIAALLAAAVELYLRSHERSHWRRVEAAAERELLGGGLQGLLRARALAVGGVTAADKAEPAATIALASAMLASEYGLDEAEAVRSATDAVEATPKASQRAQSLKLASRALMELSAGRLEQAETLARQSVALGHKQASPLFVLGRVRFRQGILPAASRAFQAALVREPTFIEARVGWAEVWLEQGERERAKENLLVALRQTPDHGRARLLLAELDTAAGGPPADWETTCARDEGKSPFIASACGLARAQRAARANDRDAAIKWAEAAGRRRPAEPRMLAGAAQLLASLGAVDRASALLDEAARIASPSLPSLRWGKLAVGLGRGQLADSVDGIPRSSSPWVPVLIARNALASAGLKALSAALSELPRENHELEVMASLTGNVGETHGASETAQGDTFHGYIEGMRARLAGRTALAVSFLGKALQEHGDACRAAGEYLAGCRELGRTPDFDALLWLRRENSRCVNLPTEPAANKSRPRKPDGKPSH